MSEQVGPTGAFKCSSCGFTQGFSKMRASDGAVGEHNGPYDKERLVCPNDDTLLHPLTWRESEADAWKVAESYLAALAPFQTAAAKALVEACREYGAFHDLHLQDRETNDRNMIALNKVLSTGKAFGRELGDGEG